MFMTLRHALIHQMAAQLYTGTVSAMSHLRFYRAILSRDSDARQSRSVRLHSRTLGLCSTVI